MATNLLNSAGADLDNVFDPYVTGTPPSATGFLAADTGADIYNRYAPLVYGTAAAATQLKNIAGADLNTLWAAKGTAHYALPFDGTTYSASHIANNQQTAYAQVNFFILSSTTYRIQIMGFATGQSAPPGVPVNYDFTIPAGAVKILATITLIATNLGGTTSNTASTWTTISSLSGSIVTQCQMQGGSQSGTKDGSWTVKIQFGNSSNQVLPTGTGTFTAHCETDGSV